MFFVLKRYSKVQPEIKVTRNKKGDVTTIKSKQKEFKFNASTKKWAQKSKIKGKSASNIQLTRRKLITKATKAEQIFRSLLRSLGIKHVFQKHIKTDTQNRYADFSLPALRCIIEIDGGYHNTPEQQLKDTDRENEIKRSVGYEVIHFTNEQVISNPDILFNALIDVLQRKFNCIKSRWNI